MNTPSNWFALLLVGVLASSALAVPPAAPPQPFPPAVQLLTRVGGTTLTWDDDAPRSLVGAQLHGPSTQNWVLGRLNEIDSLQVLSIWRHAHMPLDDHGFDLAVQPPNLSFLRVGNNTVSDAGLRSLAKTKKLRGLVLEPARVTDQGLESLGGLQCLQVLSLNGGDITNAGLAKLVALEQLQFLSLRETQITADGLSLLRGSVDSRLMKVAGQRSLKTLILPRTVELDRQGVIDLIRLMGMSDLSTLKPLKIAAPGLEREFAALKAQVDALKSRHAYADYEVSADGVLEVVGLYFQRSNQVDGDTVGVADLIDLPTSLRRLSLRGCQIEDGQDGAIRHLADLMQLEALNLFDTGSAVEAGKPWTPGITDRGLDELAALRLPNLRTLILDDDANRISDDAVQRFRQAMPNVEVIRMPLGEGGASNCPDLPHDDPRIRKKDSVALGRTNTSR